MTFTDGDLKRLKESLDTYEDEQQPCYRVKEFKALLSRLEAAEKIAEYMASARIASENLIADVEAWRKACGK